MVYAIVTPGERRASSESRGRGTSSHLAQIPSDSKLNHLNTPTLCPVCGETSKRSADLKRHILDVHLPDWICCPRPACPWRGSRIETLYKHIDKCGSARPKSVDEYEIYDTGLILHHLLIDSVPFETVVMFVLTIIEERARELKKVDAWGPLTEWRKLKR